jgi:dihydroorotase
MFQVNPPLRTEEDRLALIAGLKNGAIDYLATDHAPHTLEEKEKGISGLPQLDTYGPFAAWLIKEHNFTAEDIGRVCSQNPATFMNQFVKEPYGKIEKGFVGSLTILALNKQILITKEILKTKNKWSPFLGITFPGSVVMTVIRGQIYGK